VHQSLRDYLGLTGFAQDQSLDLDSVESLPFFDPFVSSSS
jgi:hypothetical protein